MTELHDSTPGAQLVVDGLTVRYGGPTGPAALDDVSFTLEQGSRVALVGESGSGKTTLALAIGGFLTTSTVDVQSGRFEFEGRALSARPSGPSPLPKRIPGIAMVFQDAMTSLDPTWTIGSQLRAVLRGNEKASRKALDARAAEWLRKVRLDDTDRVLAARPYELSGGMRQRVMMALALCGDPRLIIADEPTSALDASLARSTMDLLLELTEERGASLLLVSHDIQLCREFTERMLVMYHGRMVDNVDSDAADREAQHPYTKGLLRCVPTLDSVDSPRLPTLTDYFDPSTERAA
ncbi:ABC transporter ATP-binding protein [Agromyces sp. SYSU T00194]|uniref:ABC transporter ATP-binding protein n=1 Tax=Agromyces chitinivorans TaxID=3158560 RepID=UPI003394A0EA